MIMKPSMAAESFEDILRQRLEERIGHHKIAFSYADLGFTDQLFLNGTQLRHRYITLAEQQRLTWCQIGQIARQVSFCLANIDSLHACIVNCKLN